MANGYTVISTYIWKYTLYTNIDKDVNFTNLSFSADIRVDIGEKMAMDDWIWCLLWVGIIHVKKEKSRGLTEEEKLL